MATAATAPPKATTSAEPSGSTSSNAPGRSRRRGGRGGGRGGRGGRGNGGRGNSQPAAGQDDREGANTKKKGNTKRPARRGRRGSANEVAGDNVDANAQVATAAADVSSQARAPPSPSTQHALDFISDSIHHGSNHSANAANANENDAATAANANENDKNKTKKNQPAKKKKAKKKGQNKNHSQESSATGQPQQQQQGNADNEQKKKKRNRRKKKTIPKPWKDSIPQDAVDPISLDPLEDLPYPPFAIVVDEPYVPVLPGMWPPPRPTALLTKSSDTTDNNNDDRGIKEEKKQEEVVQQSKATTLADTTTGRDREIEILRAQWGEVAVRDEVDGDLQSKKELAVDKISASASPPTTATNNLQGRNFNLFDGRVLAFYLVSTLQFIDPLNRRDLTRPELEALDAYLSHHKLGNAGVVEAYDDKGVTISTAGIAAQSATGRAEILQQEATAILSSFFQRGQHGRSTQLQTTSSQQQQSRQQLQRERRDVRRVHSLGNMNNNNNGGGGQQQMNTFQRMYAAQSGRGGNQSSQQQQLQMNHDVGIYGGDDGGLLVIDDDINPGLRSGMPPDARGGGNAASIGTLHSARHIAERHSQAAQVREGNFPSLATATAASSTSGTNNADNAAAASKKPPPPSAGKSLSKISKLVKKTNPKEAERQRKARDEAQKRAELSKLSFFDPGMPSASSTGGGVGTGPMTAPQIKAPPSEGMLERNRNLAVALGVAPSTVRSEQPSLTGWARPDFGKELNAAQYPDALLAEAKERMVELLKVEKQWKKFLSDDREASCSLKPMARPLRKFIHEYSDFWRLHTESFDPEGRRYIYCAKLADTCAPYPSLSEAARKWRGPTAGPNTDTDMLLNLPTGPAPKPTTSDAPTPDGWRTEQRVRLKLAPRTVTIDQPAPPASTSGMVRSTSTPFLSMTGERPPPPRFADLHNKERPRLQLTKRSIPTWDELENRHITQEGWNAMTPDQQEAILCEIDEEETKQAAHLQRQQEKEDARVYRLEIKAKKKAAEQVKQKAILESAFASSSDDDGDGSSGSDWFEDDLEFDGSDDEGM